MDLMDHMPPVCPGVKPLCTFRVQSDVLLPEVPTEKSPCHRETLMSMTKMPQEISATATVPHKMLSATDVLPTNVLPAVPSIVPPSEAEKDPCSINLPYYPGKWRTCPGEVPPTMLPVMPASLQMPEQPSQSVPWQEERAKNHLDTVPGQESGNECFTHRHDDHRLPVHQHLSWLTYRTTTENTNHKPHRVLLLGRGQRQAMLESMLYQKYRKEMLEKIWPPPMPMESVSTTHHDYCAEGCQFTQPPAMQPHNYFMEQPCSFWLEQARNLPDVTRICSGNSPFRRNTAFSNPISDYLKQPLPCAPLGSRFRPHKQ